MFKLILPVSVINPVTNLLGVTSKAKFAAGLSFGVKRTFLISPSTNP